MIERTYRISDVINDEFLRVPLTLLANPKYKEMSLEAKFIYALLLNRLTLSQKNGWINEDNEVYLIYTREEASDMLNISYKKTISAFRELTAKGLLYEKRQGRGYPNLLYVLKAELNDDNALEFSEKYDETSPEIPLDMQKCQNNISRSAISAHQELSKAQFKTFQKDISRTAALKDAELSELHARKIYNINNNINNLENSQSISPAHTRDIDTERQADEDNDFLETIFERCELEIFQPNIRTMICNAIERMYYSETLKVGNAHLPQERVRKYLNYITSDIIIAALESMRQNGNVIVNPTSYLMSILFNSICENDSGSILKLPEECISNETLYVAPRKFREEVVDDAPK